MYIRMKTRYRGKKPLYFLVIKTIQILNMLPQVNHYHITVKQYNTLSKHTKNPSSKPLTHYIGHGLKIKTDMALHLNGG